MPGLISLTDPDSAIKIVNEKRAANKEAGKTGLVHEITAVVDGLLEHGVNLAAEHSGLATETAITFTEAHLDDLARNNGSNEKVNPVTSLVMESGIDAFFSKVREAKGENPEFVQTLVKAKGLALFKIAAEALLGRFFNHHNHKHNSQEKLESRLSEIQSTAPEGQQVNADSFLDAYKRSLAEETKNTNGQVTPEAHFKAALSAIDNIIATHPAASAALISALLSMTTDKLGKKLGNEVGQGYDGVMTAGLLTYAVAAHNRIHPDHKIGATGYVFRLLADVAGGLGVKALASLLAKPYKPTQKLGQEPELAPTL